MISVFATEVNHHGTTSTRVLEAKQARGRRVATNYNGRSQGNNTYSAASNSYRWIQGRIRWRRRLRVQLQVCCLSLSKHIARSQPQSSRMILESGVCATVYMGSRLGDVSSLPVRSPLTPLPVDSDFNFNFKLTTVSQSWSVLHEFSVLPEYQLRQSCHHL